MAHRRLIGTGLTRQSVIGHEVERGEVAESRTVTYVCGHGHLMALRFYADVDVPPQWDCRECGGLAEVLDTAGAAVAEIARPRRIPGQGKTHWEHVLERRSVPELESLLDERLALLRQKRAV